MRTRPGWVYCFVRFCAHGCYGKSFAVPDSWNCRNNRKLKVDVSENCLQVDVERMQSSWLLFCAAFSGMPAQIDIFPAHFLQTADTLRQAQTMSFENNRRYLPAQHFGYLSVAMRTVKPLQNHYFFLGPSRTSPGSFFGRLASGAGSTTYSYHINILIGRKCVLSLF